MRCKMRYLGILILFLFIFFLLLNCDDETTKEGTNPLINLNNAFISIIGTYSYTGSPLTPSFTVTLDDNPLISDIDYTTSFSNNINAGFAKLIIVANENSKYTGTKTADFTINKATGAIVDAPSISNKTSNSISINALVAPTNGQVVEYAINISNSILEIDWQTELIFNNLFENTNYYIFARSASNSNYNAGNANVSGIITTLVQGSFIISFSNIVDIENPKISNAVIYLIGGTGKLVEATFTMEDAAQYNNITWWYNNIPIINNISGEYGETLIVSSTIYNKIGLYSVTVKVEKDTKSYTKIINFEVKP